MAMDAVMKRNFMETFFSHFTNAEEKFQRDDIFEQ